MERETSRWAKDLPVVMPTSCAGASFINDGFCRCSKLEHVIWLAVHPRSSGQTCSPCACTLPRFGLSVRAHSTSPREIWPHPPITHIFLMAEILDLIMIRIWLELPVVKEDWWSSYSISMRYRRACCGSEGLIVDSRWLQWAIKPLTSRSVFMNYVDIKPWNSWQDCWIFCIYREYGSPKL